MLGILKHINEPDDVGVLAHLEHLDLHSLLLDVERLQVLLLDRLDGHLVPALLMLGQFDNAKLSFAELAIEIVVFVNIVFANDVFESFVPFCL